MKLKIVVLTMMGLLVLLPAARGVARGRGDRSPIPPAGPMRPTPAKFIPAGEPVPLAEIHTDASVAKAVTDSVTLMGPAGLYPYRGDFETAAALPDGDGALPDGWTSTDLTAPPNHWHIATYNNPGTGNAVWCGDDIPSCEAGDPVGGYGNSWYDVLEFRHAVTDPAAPTAVRVQAVLRHDSEPGYDYTYLVRRTNYDPNFEPITPPGQGLAWDDAGTVTLDYTFHFNPGEYLGGEIRLAFLFDSDGGWSDADCLYFSAGGAIVDNLLVTCTGGLEATFSEDFEDGVIGPDWSVPLNQGVGDFAHVWNRLCVDDPCHENRSQQVAFINTVPELDPLPWPPAGCGGVDFHGGFLGPSFRLGNAVDSPVMPLPPGADGVTLAFDVYQEGPTYGYIGDWLWTWYVRSAATATEVRLSPWRNRNFYYYGLDEYKRAVFRVSDLLTSGATAVQVRLVLQQNPYVFDPTWPTESPSPYFDNVRVTAYHDVNAGPYWSVTESSLANDGFPASGTLNLADLGSNSVRFDMAKNVAARSHLRNDPGDTICVDVVPRAGATLDTPVMHWTLARRNPLFDPYRTLPANPVVGVKARNVGFSVVPDRWRFDLPDTGMLFPGDVLQYYFSATDHRGGDARTTTMPTDLSGFGTADPRYWPALFTMRCLPTVTDAAGQQPRVLYWNDQGNGAGDDEIYNALRQMLRDGVDVDIYTTRAPASAVGNGLGGRATVAQVAGYTDLLYTSGALSSPTLSTGAYDGVTGTFDAGNDLALLNGWLALGGRDLLLSGDDLAFSLSSSGVAAQAFLQSTMGVQYQDTDVRDDINGQWSPLVVTTAANPVFMTVADWPLRGHCPDHRVLDRVTALPGAVRLAQFTAPDGVATPYPWAAAVLSVAGSNRAITLDHDLSVVATPSGSGDGAGGRRAAVLADVLNYFEVPHDPFEPTGVPAATATLAVSAQPNPFNPAVTLRYALPAPGHVTMKVFDARGRLVRTLLDEAVEAATGVVTWRGDDARGARAASGAYFVETRAGGQVDVHKVTMLK
jgi:hypothetical protein